MPFPIALGLRLGGLVASATAGVLIGFGVRAGDPLLRLRLTAAPLLGGGAGAAADASVLTAMLGLLVHTGWSILTGVAFALAFARVRGAATYAAAAAVAVVVLLLQGTIAPWIGGSSPAFPLSVAQRIMLAVTIALALAIGMRLALPRDEWSRDRREPWNVMRS